jgi:hypothetical protein
MVNSMLLLLTLLAAVILSQHRQLLALQAKFDAVQKKIDDVLPAASDSNARQSAGRDHTTRDAAQSEVNALRHGPTRNCTHWLWFSGLHEGANSRCSAGFGGYYNQYAAALMSAQTNALPLKPVLLLGRYGMENCTAQSPFGRWARSSGVRVITVDRLSFQDQLVHGLAKSNPGDDHLMGPFLRLHIPTAIRQHNLLHDPNICKDIVLYTDSDVLFMKVTEKALASVRHTFKQAKNTSLLYSVESIKDNPAPINTGVMFIHLTRFAKIWPTLLDFGQSKLFRFPSYDQGWINAFNELYPETSGYLDFRWNWKVYWGGNGNASEQPYIIHFHGPKPGRGPYLECLASRNSRCLRGLKAHPYVRFVARGFKADGGTLANQSLVIYESLATRANHPCDD